MYKYLYHSQSTSNLQDLRFAIFVSDNLQIILVSYERSTAKVETEVILCFTESVGIPPTWFHGGPKISDFAKRHCLHRIIFFYSNPT